MTSKIRTSPAPQDAAARLSNAMSQWLAETEPTTIWRTCATCINLGSDDRTCSKVGKQPPVSVVVTGCDMYNDAFDIPF